MPIPKSVTKYTNHKVPRLRRYQPGFNPANGSWMNGSWINAPVSWDLDALKTEHEALYPDLYEQSRQQNWRDPGVELADMTPAQRQAWEHFSGIASIAGRSPDGQVGQYAANLKAGRLDQETIEGWKNAKLQFFRFVKNGKTITDQTAGLGLPEDLIIPGDEPHDPWAHIVSQNRTRDRQLFNSLVGGAFSTAAPVFDGNILSGGIAAFVGAMAFTSLLVDEKEIIRVEHHEAKTGEKSSYQDLPSMRIAVGEKRAALKAKFGEAFETHYETARASHNSCSRANLDNSDGRLYCYVVPAFHDDGTHDPIGDRDIPWNAP